MDVYPDSGAAEPATPRRGGASLPSSGHRPARIRQFTDPAFWSGRFALGFYETGRANQRLRSVCLRRRMPAKGVGAACQGINRVVKPRSAETKIVLKRIGMRRFRSFLAESLLKEAVPDHLPNQVPSPTSSNNPHQALPVARPSPRLHLPFADPKV